MKGGLRAGAILLVLSSWPLFLMAREFMAHRQVSSRYAFYGIYDLKDRIGQTEVELRDSQPISSSASFEAHGPIQILVSGKDYSSPAIASIRTHYKDSNRYHGSAHLLRAKDKVDGASYLIAVQNLGSGGKSYYPNVHWRALWIGENGSVREDTFGYEDRCDPPVRVWLANWATPSNMGCRSNILQAWPTLFFPILFPWISGALGILLVLICGAVEALRGRKIADSA